MVFHLNFGLCIFSLLFFPVVKTKKLLKNSEYHLKFVSASIEAVVGERITFKSQRVRC